MRDFASGWADLDGFHQQGLKWPRVRELFSAMGERGWLSLAWPKEDGGLGLPPSYEYILWDEIGYARLARNPLSSGIVAKTIVRHGTTEQKQRWLPGIKKGEIHFSLGYSEPEAGSDLTGLRTRAEKNGTGYVINGQKCWQSYAQDMDCLWLLARTGTQESRGRGLSLFIVPLDTAGLTVNPLPTLDGDQLNEIFLEDVEVTEDARVGPEDGAWKIMNQALADERHIQFPPGRVRRDLEDVATWLKDAGLTSDPIVRRRLGELAAEVEVVEVEALRVLDAMMNDGPAAVEAAANKIIHTLCCQHIAEAAIELGGAEALVEGAGIELLWRVALWETIGGGTTEIMRSVVARHGLKLTADR